MGTILALDQAQRKGFLLANRCFLCHSKGERSHSSSLCSCSFLSLVWLGLSPPRLRRHSLGGMVPCG